MLNIIFSTECPVKHFTVKGSKKPFIIYKDELRYWNHSMEKCEAEMMEPVHPSNEVAVTLRKYLLDACGMYTHT